MIPKIIHQIWFQGEENIKINYKKSHETVKKGAIENNWQYMFWDEDKIVDLIKNYPNFESIYLYFDLMIQKIDIAKYVILYHYGGIYIDMDMEWIKDFTDLINDKNLIVNKLLDINYLNNAVILSKPKHPFWLFYIDEINNNKVKEWYHNQHLYVQYTTGPILFTKVVNEYIKNNTDDNNNITNDITIFEPYYFEPCKSKYQCKLTDKARLKNNFENSWMTPFERVLIFIYTFYKEIIIFIIFFIIIYYIYKWKH